MKRRILVWSVLIFIILYHHFVVRAAAVESGCTWSKEFLVQPVTVHPLVCGSLEIKRENTCYYMRSIISSPKDPWYRVVPGHLYQLDNKCEFQLKEDGTIRQGVR